MTSINDILKEAGYTDENGEALFLRNVIQPEWPDEVKDKDGGNKIKVNRFGNNWETVEIEFNDDKTMMTVTPALTSVDDEEQWFHID